MLVWKWLVGLLLAPYRGPCETSYTPETWLAGFLLATDTGGDDLTGDRYRWLQVGNRPEISPIFPNPVSTPATEFGPQWHLCLSGGGRLTSFYAVFHGQNCLGYFLDPVINNVKVKDTVYLPWYLYPSILKTYTTLKSSAATWPVLIQPTSLA